MSGGRGVNDDYIFPTSYTGFAGNALQAPDTKHLIYGGAATAKNNLTSSHKMDLGILERAKTKAATLGGGTARIPRLEPIKIDGETRYVCLMHPFSVYDLRTNSSTGQWMDIQKAASGHEGRGNPMFEGSLGMYAGIILHEHQGVIGFSDYGSGVNLNARRNLFLGRQAAVVAFGSAGGEGMARFEWTEEMEDRGNQVVITSSTIVGMKKTAFTVDGTSYDFGIVSMDVYATDPNP